MPIKNWLHFSTITHYDGLLIDHINNLYELIFGSPKHRDFASFNENLPTKYAYGIVPVNKTHTLNIKPILNADKRCFSEKMTLLYLTDRQNSTVPFLPIRGYRGNKTHQPKIKPCHCKGYHYTIKISLKNSL